MVEISQFSEIRDTIKPKLLTASEALHPHSLLLIGSALPYLSYLVQKVTIRNKSDNSYNISLVFLLLPMLT